MGGVSTDKSAFIDVREVERKNGIVKLLVTITTNAPTERLAFDITTVLFKYLEIPKDKH